MEKKMRGQFQGTWNIIRFNWHFYALSVIFVVALFLLWNNTTQVIAAVYCGLATIIIASTALSVAVSFFIYDCSQLYKFTWLEEMNFSDDDKIVNINAGFDETSRLIKDKFPYAELVVLDFYDPEKHTEVSIKRARNAYPPFPSATRTRTDHLPLEDSTADKILIILAAHEIRDYDERVLFFKELNRILAPSGQIIVTEHLRDAANFFAFNIGFFHFYSKASWLRTFRSSGLQVRQQFRITQFITTFILKKNGVAP
jgi:ubiquinone/menaquinone biosynthesis C-methylase UbiE